MVKFGRAMAMFTAALGACDVGSLDLSGKACPCATGYVCNPATNTCVRSLPTDGDGGGVEDSGGADAAMADATDSPTLHGLDMANLVKISLKAPLLDGPVASSSDCGRFTISYAPESNLQADELVATTFIDPATKNFWIPYACKDLDNGWNVALASWDRVAAKATIATPVSKGGINPIFGVDDIRNDGLTVISVRQLHMTFGGDGRVYGTISAYNSSTGTSQMLPVIGASPLKTSTKSMHTDDPTVLQGDGTGWYAKAGLGTEVLFYSGTFYLYSLHTDGTTLTAAGHAFTSIGLSTSTDMLSSKFRTTPLVTGWTDPMVSYDSGMFHMVARKLSDNNLYYVRGTAPDQFDFDHPQLIDLVGRAGAPGAWDALRWPAHPGSDQPLLASARVIDGTMYIFYMAGSPNDPGGAYPEEKRGLGVFTVPVLP